MTRHLVVAPIAGYNGKTLGVPFHDGQAIVDEHSVDKKLGRTPAQVIESFKKDFPDYAVEPLGGPGVVSVPELPWKGEKAEGGPSTSSGRKAEDKPKPNPKRAAKKAG